MTGVPPTCERGDGVRQAPVLEPEADWGGGLPYIMDGFFVFLAIITAIFGGVYWLLGWAGVVAW